MPIIYQEPKANPPHQKVAAAYVLVGLVSRPPRFVLQEAACPYLSMMSEFTRVPRSTCWSMAWCLKTLSAISEMVMVIGFQPSRLGLGIWVRRLTSIQCSYIIT